jgi:hypothetical protein
MTGTTQPHYLQGLGIVRVVHLALYRATGHTALPHQLPAPQVHVSVATTVVLATLLLRHRVRTAPAAHVFSMAGHAVTALGPPLTAITVGANFHRGGGCCLRDTGGQDSGPRPEGQEGEKCFRPNESCKTGLKLRPPRRGAGRGGCARSIDRGSQSNRGQGTRSRGEVNRKSLILLGFLRPRSR